MSKMCSTLYFVMTMVFLVGFPVNHSLPFPSGTTEWPLLCKGKTYCHIKPKNYPTERFSTLLQDDTSVHISTHLAKRSVSDNATYSETRDVAGCTSRVMYHPLYLIKDRNDRVRFVVQHPNFSFTLRVEECRNPGRIYSSSRLEQNQLTENRVDCVERRVPLNFLVLSTDGSRLESAVVKDGIPISCSGKIMVNV